MDIVQAPPVKNSIMQCLLPGRFLIAHRPKKNAKDNEVYTFDDLLKFYPKVKGVLDLQRAPRRWYKKEILYKRVVLPGGPEAVPSRKKILECINFIDSFRKKYPGKLLYIHCRHGLNRTGIICSLYMKKYNIANPVEVFMEKRGTSKIRPHIYSFITNLQI